MTNKQKQATKRNWKIRSLRAFYALSRQLAFHRSEQVRILVDEELAILEAKSCFEHIEEQLQKQLAKNV